MLYEELLELWINEKKIEILNSTYNNYMYTIKRRIKPTLGNYDILHITRRILQDFIIQQSKNKKRETIVNITKVLSQSFAYAIDNDYISENPYRNIKVPKDKYHKEIQIYEKEEIEKILAVEGFLERNKNIINIAYRTGMRIGEILALKWEDINFKQKFLTVRRTLSGYSNGKAEIYEPKTKKSRRRIDLDEVSIEVFKSIKQQGEFIFCKKDGTLLSRQCVTDSLKRMCKAAEIPYRSFHALRHTHASILLSENIHPKIVQERLGHAKISTTLDIYSHLIPSAQKVAVEVFNNIS